MGIEARLGDNFLRCLNGSHRLDMGKEAGAMIAFGGVGLSLQECYQKLFSISMFPSNQRHSSLNFNYTCTAYASQY